MVREKEWAGMDGENIVSGRVDSKGARDSGEDEEGKVVRMGIGWMGEVERKNMKYKGQIK